MTTPSPFYLPLALAIITAGLPLPVQSAQPAPIVAYRLTFEPGAPPRVELRLTGLLPTDLEDGLLVVAMPAWKPGSYTIRDFGKNVRNLRAAGGAREPLAISQIDANTWSIEAAAHSEIVLRYELELPHIGRPFGPGYSLARGLGRRVRIEVDGESRPAWRAYEFEGTATWMYVPARIDVPHSVTFDLPDDWKIATGLRETADARTFAAPDFDVFTDCPFHVGEFETRELTHDGVRYRIVWSGFEGDRHDRDAIVDRYRKIVAATVDLMGPAPFEDYVFLIGFPGSGGLEHLNSTNLGFINLAPIWDSVVSHEFFHAWNVKRLRPRPLGPFDYSGPVRTPYLWLVEGVTSYYGGLLLCRAGLQEPERFWRSTIAGEIHTLQKNPGRKKMSIAEASRTVWDAPYMRRGRTAPNYYNKGLLLGLLLDVEIRAATDNERSLDDVMVGLYRQCTTEGRGFAEGDVRRTCEAVSGADFGDFFARYVDGTDELPYAEVLAKIGLPVTAPGDSKRRRWTLRFDPEAPQSAVRMREHITRDVVGER